MHILFASMNPDEMDLYPTTWFLFHLHFLSISFCPTSYSQGVVLTHNASARVIRSNQSLVLQRVTRHSAGNYSCSAINAEGETVSNQLELRVKCKYTISIFAYFWLWFSLILSVNLNIFFFVSIVFVLLENTLDLESIWKALAKSGSDYITHQVSKVFSKCVLITFAIYSSIQKLLHFKSICIHLNEMWSNRNSSTCLTTVCYVKITFDGFYICMWKILNSKNLFKFPVKKHFKP